MWVSQVGGRGLPNPSEGRPSGKGWRAELCGVGFSLIAALSTGKPHTSDYTGWEVLEGQTHSQLWRLVRKQDRKQVKTLLY